MPADTKHVIITGIVPPFGGNPGIRKEFAKWSKDPEQSIQVSLFIRALQRFYDRPYQDTLSFFQVASIHGYPGDLEWDNSEPPKNGRKEYTHKIYCTHNMLTFPTWHRPYMALFEQTLYELMGEVIETLDFARDDDKQAWIHAAAEWRLPYWDWALKENTKAIPFLFRESNIKIRAPVNSDGSAAEPNPIPNNPLTRYQLRTLPWSQCSGTSRYGITSTHPTQEESEGKNDFAKISTALQQHQYYPPKEGDDTAEINKLAISDLISRMMSSVHDWASFSTTATYNDSKELPHKWENWVSLEYIHNNLHGFIGGGNGFTKGVGHMCSVPVAAFDPIFYMHHCNIDRLFSIWQCLNGDSWFASGTTPNSCSPLTPFHGQFGGRVNYFDSNEARCWRTLGYDYDSVDSQENEDEADHKTRLKKYIDNTYQDTSTVVLRDEFKLYSIADMHSDTGNHTYDDYIANVVYDRYGNKGGKPYTIHFILGAPNISHEIVSLMRTARASDGLLSSDFPRQVGSIYTFSSPLGNAENGVPQCANCQQQHDDGVLSRATVPLTVPLYQDAGSPGVGEIHNMKPNSVRGHLADNLSWVAVGTDGIVIPWENLPKTKVYILEGKAEHCHEVGKLSYYHDYQPLPETTVGKPAGALRVDYGLQEEE
ncbi:hypothetical protein B0T24DRAFT_585983 [Lasiosphaeria ovina]|uniref:tyrosinase n=1 Tax=Lasiosphaeria ovina TaxID=92902 RepID=A0AAE0MZ33_9PEZI|nr:hypothetical protein B0T24DRAFT_585983 [Lasiosphaeria ovina]